MNDTNGMDAVIKSLRGYINSIDKFYTGEKTNVSSDDLTQLNDDLKSENDKIESSFNPEYQSESFSKIIDSLSNLELENEVMPYTEVTKLVYSETQHNTELYDFLKDEMEFDWKNYKKNHELAEIKVTTQKYFLKIKEHVGLSIAQKNHINDRLNTRLNETINSLDEANRQIEDLSSKVNEVEEEAKKKSDQIVMNFITILGIFAAVMMGAFGAFQGFTSMLSSAKSVPIGNILLISSVGAIILSLILFLLMYSISKLTSIKFSNCNCQNKNKGVLSRVRASLLGVDESEYKPKCDCSIFEKYPAITLINYIFYYIAITGVLLKYFYYRNYFDDNIGIQLLYTVAMYVLLSFVLAFIHRYVITKKTNDSFFKNIKKDLKKLLLKER